MSDSRYRQGIYTNRRGQRHQAAINHRAACRANNPKFWGWEESGKHSEFNLTLYRQQNCTLMAHPTEAGKWVVWQGKDCFSYPGTVQQVTSLFFENVPLQMVTHQAA